MKPAPHNIELTRGDDFELFFRVRTKVWDVPTQSWVPGDYIDCTGWTGISQFRASADDVDPPALEFTVTLGNQTTTPGSWFVRATDVQTAALTTLEGVYDVELTDAGGLKSTWLGGTVTINKDVSRV